MAWLVGFGPPPANPEDAALRSRISSAIDATHFCVSTTSGTDASLDPWLFAQDLARQFSSLDPVYGQTLADLLPGVNISMLAGSVGTQIGPKIGTINLGDAASLFNVVCTPLKTLASQQPERSVVVLVDALDEAGLWPSVPSIVELVASGSGADAPPNLRFLVTSRPDPDVVERFPERFRWDLVRDSPSDARDVFAYVRARIAERAPSADPGLAEKIAEASGGNFLYVEQALDYWLPRLSELASVEELELPPGLDSIYALFLQREYGAENGKGRWQNQARPLLATVGAAQERLGSPALRWILATDDDRLQDSLRMCEQYLGGRRPDGPFGIYHQSFREFLFDGDRNQRFPVALGDAHARIARRYLDSYSRSWQLVHDDYGVRHVATHLAAAAVANSQPIRHELASALRNVVLDPSFQQAHEDRLDDPAALVRDADLAVVTLAMDDAPAAVAEAIEAALGLTALRRGRLQPARLFELALTGDLAAALRRLDSYPADDVVRDAARLSLAWAAAASDPAGAHRVLDTIRPRVGHLPNLALLATRLAGVLGVEPPPAVNPGPPPPGFVAKAIVDRLGGTDLRTSPSVLAEHFVTGGEILAGMEGGSEGALGTSPEVVLAADHEGPALVAFAAAYPDPGDRLFSEYVSLHASNTYVHYRNRSLMVLLGAALRHPSDPWVGETLQQLVTGALAGNALDFEECLRIQSLAVRATRDAGALSRLEAEQSRAVAAASQLRGGPDSEGDSWGAHKRLLGGLAEGLAVALSRIADADSLLVLAGGLPFGFAGFQGPACLTLAESVRICRPVGAAESARLVHLALAAAHNVQDPLLCVRLTSRVRLAEHAWWPLPEPLPALAEEFATQPNARRFTSTHVVGEAYEGRAGTEASVPLPPFTREAATLADLAQVYERPLSEIARLNGEIDPRTQLAHGTIVRIPDPEVIPLTAARLAAEALIAPGLGPRDRVRIVQRMVPLAASNPTALDTVLGRLALAARFELAGQLDMIDAAGNRYRADRSSLDVSPNRLLPS